MADSLARRETLKAVTDAVLALDEPYQTAVFLRYFESLPPRAIAKRTGANIATVKSRLARGLQMLRARLDGGASARRAWRPALAFTFGLPLAPVSLLPTGVLLMTATPKVLLVAGVLCAGSLWWLHDGDATLSPHTDAVQGAGAAAVAAAARVPEERVAASEREAGLADAPGESWLAHPYTLELELFVVDAWGLPKADYHPRFAPTGLPMVDAGHATDAHGRVVLQWRARQPSMVVDIEDPLGGLRHRLVVRHGTRVQRALLAGSDRGKIQFSVGLQRDVSLMANVTFAKSDFDQWTRTTDQAESYANTFRDATSVPEPGPLHPYAVFHAECLAPVQEPAPKPRTNVDLALSELLAYSTYDRVQWLGERLMTREPSAPTPEPGAAVSGTVFDERGAPAPRTAVMLFGDDPRPIAQTSTGDDGTFAFAGIAPGTWRVRAGGDRLGLATTSIAIVDQQTSRTSLHLQTGACIRGRALAADGAPLANAQLEWRSLDGTAVDGTQTDERGTFVFANHPGGPGTVLLFPDGERRLPIAIARTVLPDTGELLLHASAGGALQLAPRFDDRPAAGEAIVRILQIETGLTMRAEARSETGGTYAAERLLPGAYEIELHQATGGLRSLGTQWLTEGQTTDLGVVVAPRCGEVEFTGSGSESTTSFALYALRPDADLGAMSLPSLTTPQRLPAGSYALAWRARAGDVQFQRFAVQEGRRTTVELHR